MSRPISATSKPSDSKYKTTWLQIGVFPFDHTENEDPNSAAAYMEVWLQQIRSQFTELPHIQETIANEVCAAPPRGGAATKPCAVSSSEGCVIKGVNMYMCELYQSILKSDNHGNVLLGVHGVARWVTGGLMSGCVPIFCKYLLQVEGFTLDTNKISSLCPGPRPTVIKGKLCDLN